MEFALNPMPLRGFQGTCVPRNGWCDGEDFSTSSGKGLRKPGSAFLENLEKNEVMYPGSEF